MRKDLGCKSPINCLMEKEADTKAEKLLERLNELLAKMPELAKQAEILQLRRMELEKACSLPEISKEAEQKNDSAQDTAETAHIAETELFVRKSPENVIDEHRRLAVFFYEPSCIKLLENVLKTIDSASLASASTPMFVERAAVKDTNSSDVKKLANDFLQKNIAGLVYIGLLDDKTAVDLSDMCREAGMAFLHIDEETFSQSAIMDFLIELIAIEKVGI